jgi:membrane protease YdiL (CAAX protease family)
MTIPAAAHSRTDWAISKALAARAECSPEGDVKLWPLPKSNHVVSPRSGIALVGAALCLLPIDLALAVYGWRNPVVVGMTTRDGFEEPLHGIPDWVSGLRLGIPVVVLVALLVMGRIRRADAGLTLGSPRVTMFWIGAPLLLVAAIAIPFVAIRVLIYRWNGSAPSPLMIEPSPFGHQGFWGNLFHLCVLYPLMEEVLYRGIYVPALEHAIGPKFAVFAMGMTWTMLHWMYGWPMVAAVIVQYSLLGMVFALAMLKTRSLAAPLTLHAVGNLVNPILIDWVKINHADFIRGLFGGS